MTTYTPGALRAAQTLHDHFGVDADAEDRDEAATSVRISAECISRETGDAGLLEALKELLENYRTAIEMVAKMGAPGTAESLKLLAVGAEKAIAQAQEGKP